MGSMHVGLQAFSPNPNTPTAVPGISSKVELLGMSQKRALQHIDEITVKTIAAEDELVAHNGALCVVRRAKSPDTGIPPTILLLVVRTTLALRRVVLRAILNIV